LHGLRGIVLAAHIAPFGKDAPMNMDSLFSAKYHPLVVTPRADATADALCEYLTANRGGLRQLLLEHGGLLFRGFRVVGPADFKRCAESFGAQPFEYVGGNSPRSRIGADVYTSTEYPPSEAISLHNEMSYLPNWPQRLFFFSAVPSPSGGQTSLAHARDVLSGFPSELVTKFRDKQLNYIRNFKPDVPLGKSWQDTYLTHDRDELETILTEQGSTGHWSDDGALRVSTHCVALTEHPQTGEEVWFNQAEQWHPSALHADLRNMLEGMVGPEHLPHDCEFGDGEAIDEDSLRQVRSVLHSSKLLFDWQQGDLLVIDNLLMMHGREPFKGQRQILVYLSSN
jgi:alpha-ketoglutarate-dependent taurine dioxygenase